MRSIAIMNQKGGCGKTISAINISAFLSSHERRVLLIDLDPQGHATLGLQTNPIQSGKTISEVLLREEAGNGSGLAEVRRTVLPNLDLVPADILLSAVPEKLSAVAGKENRLTEAIAEVRKQYHYVIVDCPPNVGLLTFNALLACSETIIPLDPSFFSLHGIGKLMETLDVVARKTGHEIEARALITLYPGRSEFVREVVENIRKHLGDRVFKTVIRYSVKLAEAASHGLPITEYCRRCVGFDDYAMVAEEILQEEVRRPVLRERLESKSETESQEGAFEGISLPSAPIATGEGVLFTLEAPDAGRVQVAGDFNAWEPNGNEMQFSSGVWRKMIALAPGRYHYRYVVDGQWCTDPLNAEAVPSPYGGYDSVIVLDESKPGG